MSITYLTLNTYADEVLDFNNQKLPLYQTARNKISGIKTSQVRDGKVLIGCPIATLIAAALGAGLFVLAIKAGFFSGGSDLTLFPLSGGLILMSGSVAGMISTATVAYWVKRDKTTLFKIQNNPLTHVEYAGLLQGEIEFAIIEEKKILDKNKELQEDLLKNQKQQQLSQVEPQKSSEENSKLETDLQYYERFNKKQSHKTVLNEINLELLKKEESFIKQQIDQNTNRLEIVQKLKQHYLSLFAEGHCGDILKKKDKSQ